MDFEGVTLSEPVHLWVSVTNSGPIKLCVHSHTDFQTVALKLTEEKFLPLRIAVGRSRLEIGAEVQGSWLAVNVRGWNRLIERERWLG